MKVTGFSRVSKDAIIRDLEKELNGSTNFFITQYGSVSASAMDQLRAKLRLVKSRYIVVKNSLGKKAFEKSSHKQLAGTISGSCGVVFSGADPVAPTKVLVQFAKENEAFKIQTGCMNGKLISMDEIKVLASLPPKEVLIARALGGMMAPLSRLVGVLSGTVRSVVNVLDAIAKKKQ